MAYCNVSFLPLISLHIAAFHFWEVTMPVEFPNFTLAWRIKCTPVHKAATADYV